MRQLLRALSRGLAAPKPVPAADEPAAARPVAAEKPPAHAEGLPVRVYATRTCGFCRAAVRLLDAREIPFEQIDVTGDTDARAWLREATGRHTVPQIFIGEEPIGGFTELAGLDASGELARKLGA